MRSPPLPHLALVLLAGALAYWLVQGRATVTPPVDNQAGSASSNQPSSNGAWQNDDANALRVARADSTTAARAQTESHRAIRPHASDATWVDIQVVNAAGEAVPSAIVYWYDNKASELLEDDNTIDGVERMMIYRQPCELARRHGWSVPTDENGKARVTLFDPTFLAGTADGMFGHFVLDPSTPEPEGGHRLVLLPDANVTVLVLDDQDKPCSGVPVTLVVLDSDTNLLGNYGLNAMARSGDDGIAVIAHIQEWRRLMFSDPGYDDTPNRAHVHAMLPQHDDLGSAIDLYNPPTDVIVLRMPACGSARMRVDFPGIPDANTHEMVLNGDATSRYGGYFVGRPAHDGWTYFQHVPIQKRYRATSLAAVNINHTFAGPTFRGDVVEVVITRPTNLIMLRCRIVDEQGEPVTNKHFSARLSGSCVPSHLQFRTDGGGSALITIRFDPNADAVAIESGTISMIGADTGYGIATIAPMTLRPGVFDLGDLNLERGRPVAAGQLMAGGVPYKLPISVSLTTFDPAATTASDRWRAMHAISATIDDHGRFDVRANLPEGQHRLQFHGLHNQPVDPVPFRVGQQDLVVEIPVGHSLSASYFLPEGVDADEVQCHIVRSSSSSDKPRQDFQTYPDRGQAERCTMRWHGLPAGTYTLEMALWAQPKPLVRIPDVVVPPPATGDARLIDIDLRQLVQVVTVELLEPEGGQLDGYGALFPAGQMVAGNWRGYSVFGAKTRLLLPPGQVDLVAAIEGYQPTPVRGVGPNLSARMFPWPKVKLRLAEPAPLPATFQVLMQIEGTRQDKSWFGPNSEDSLAALVGVEWRPWPLEDGIIELQIGNGAHRLRVFVGNAHRHIEVHGVTPAQILPTQRDVTVTVPKASWQAAIDAFSKPPK